MGDFGYRDPDTGDKVRGRPMPEPVTIEVNPLRLFTQYRHARMKAKHGMGLARNAGTVASIREEYHLPPSIRTWAQLADELQVIEGEVRAKMEGG